MMVRTMDAGKRAEGYLYLVTRRNSLLCSKAQNEALLQPPPKKSERSLALGRYLKLKYKLLAHGRRKRGKGRRVSRSSEISGDVPLEIRIFQLLFS